MAWIFLVCVGFGLLIGLFIGGLVGFMTGYDWAMGEIARVDDQPVTVEEMGVSSYYRSKGSAAAPTTRHRSLPRGA